MDAVASFAGSCSPWLRTSAAITPTHPTGVTSGAAIAPLEEEFDLTVWSREVLNASAVAFSASRRIVPSLVTTGVG
jgi:hypothetical protein